MSDQFQTEVFDAQGPDVFRAFPPLPAWLRGRLLRPGEHVTWVCGPRFNPAWERYATHPALFLFALAVGAACLGASRLLPGAAGVAGALVAGGIVLGSVFVLALSSGYFTRLVVTDHRLVILQGYEVCRSWGLDDLPRSLVRYGRQGVEAASPAVDLDTLRTMLGGSSDKFVDSKTILAFGKQLEQIKSLEKGRP
jgi:hypothetical protein